MSPYRFQYNESESDIKDYNFFYKNTKKAKALSNIWLFLYFWENFENSKISKHTIIFYFVLCISSKIRIL